MTLTVVRIFIFWILIFIPFVIPQNNIAFAQKTSNSFISIVNPVRISLYTKNSGKSIKAQYEQIKNRDLPATWLITFDVLTNEEALNSLKEFDRKQELGIFMEVSKASAKAANVMYNQTDSWHRSNSLFLSGYSQKDRIKFIDSAFLKFKEEFGYYPVSVGAWWIDSFSLDYMARKYKITANLNVSDQLGTDGYHVWGTYWSSPYYPRLNNAGMPANDSANKIDVVTLRWAPRDPLNGYKSPDERESTRFSTQDYFTIGLGHDYFESLLRLYTNRDFGQITIGLEGDFPPEVYSKDFSAQLSIAQKLEEEGKIRFSTMKDFATLYKKEYPNFSPPLLIETDDLLGTNKKIFWFQNPNYRAGLVYYPELNQTEIIDLRSYYDNFPEPFNLSPNKQYDLFSIVPAIIDSKTDTGQKIRLDTGYLINSDNNSITFEKGEVMFEERKIKLDGLSKDIYIPQNFVYSPDGLEFSEIKPKIPFAIKSRLPQALIYFLVSFLALTLIAMFIVLREKKPRYAKYLIFVAVIICLAYVISRMNRSLYVSQSEIDALFLLQNLNDGKVLLYDKDCLRCTWTGNNKPAAMEGRKDYVERLSKKKIVYSLDLVLAKNPDEAKKILRKTNAKYIYLTKYEDYIEQIAFNPKDLGIKKIFENANATIFQIY